MLHVIEIKIYTNFNAFFVLYGIMNVLLDHFIILPNFQEIERDEAQKHSERAVRAVKKEIHHLDSLCHDWSAWDKIHTFAETPSRDYAEDNLPLTLFTDNEVNLICICNKEGKVLWGEAYDSEKETIIQLTDFPKDFFPENHPLFSLCPAEKKSPAERSVSGLLMTQKGIMMVASRPLLTRNNEGPVPGTLITGRFLNDNIVKMLVEQVRADFRIFPIQAGSMSETVRDVPKLITEESPYLIRNEDDAHLLVYTTFPDIRGETGFLVQSRIHKSISEKGLGAVHYALILETGMLFALIILLIFLIHQIILRPIKHLTNNILSVGETGDLSARVSISSRDEIGTLATGFDRIVTKLEEQTDQLANVNKALKKDIIEREQTEEALRESEERYRSFVQNFQGIAFRRDMNFAPQFLHGAVEEITGYTEDDFLSGTPEWDEVVHPEDQPELADVTEKLFSIPNYSNRKEYRIIRKDGQVRWVHQFISTVCDDSGKPACIQGSLYDITDQLRTEKALHESENYCRLLLYSMHDEIIVVDRNHKITDVNKDFLVTAGRRRDEVLGRYCFNIYPGFHELFERRGPNRKLRDVFNTGNSYSCRHKDIAHNGSDVWTELLMSPLADENGDMTHVIIAMRNVTREVHLENHMRLTQKMEAIGTLAGGIAYNFNTILMSIMVNIEFALKKRREISRLAKVWSYP